MKTNNRVMMFLIAIVLIITGLLIWGIYVDNKRIIQITSILEFTAVATYVVFSYKLWESTKVNTDIIKEQTGLLQNQINLQYRPIVSIRDIDANADRKMDGRMIILFKGDLFNSGNSLAKIIKCQSKLTLYNRDTEQTLPEREFIDDLSKIPCGETVIPGSERFVEIAFEISDIEFEDTFNGKIILKIFSEISYEWHELNKIYITKQLFVLIKATSYYESETGNRFYIDAMSCTIDESK